MTATPDHHEVLIVGGGSAGITVAARLLRAPGAPRVAILEPSETHDYQPLWTLVGGGEKPRDASRRPEASVIPSGATWIRDAVATFAPDENAVVTAGGTRLTYDALVVATNHSCFDWERIADEAQLVVDTRNQLADRMGGSGRYVKA